MTASHSDFLRIRGLRCHVRRWGNPAHPRLLLGTGWLDVAATFAPVAEPLAERFHVLCADWRGLGHSEWPQDGYWFPDYVADLEAIADHYSPHAPLLMAGHSMGAQVMSLYAGLRPERVRKLALLDGLFLPDMEPALAPKRFVAWLEELRNLPEHRDYPSFEALARRVKKQHPQLSDDKALFIARCWGHADGHGRIRLLADPKHRLRGPGLFRAAESYAIWKQVTAPTLFLDGGKSLFRQAIPAAEKAARRACFRTHREELIEDAGHMLHFDAPEQTARHLGAFFAGDPAGTT